MDARNLLDVPLGTHDLTDFDRALVDEGDTVWVGGISIRITTTDPPTYRPKLGTFWSPAVLDKARAPDIGSKEWLLAKGMSADLIMHQPCSFAELDDGTIPEQLDRIATAIEAGMPEPTAVVLSGDHRPDGPISEGKSVHLFWRIGDGTWDVHDKQDEADRMTVQGALVHVLGSDPSIADPFRRMRLGGVVSRQTGPYSSIEGNPDTPARHQTVLHIGPRVSKRALLSWARKQKAPPLAAGSARHTKRLHAPFADTYIAEYDDQLDQLADIAKANGKLIVTCPWHEDSTPSAFIAVSETTGKLYLNCSVCRTTWFDRPTVDLVTSKKGTPLQLLTNVERILEGDPSWVGRLWYNQRTRFVMLDEKPLPEHAINAARTSMYRTYGFEPTKNNAHDGMNMAAHRNPRNPLVEWLKGLEWDGEERLDTWLPRYLRVEDKPLYRAYGRMFLISAVARAMHPGCKMDTTLLVIGAQGSRKSTLFRVLAGDEWYADTPLDLKHPTDTAMKVAQAWVYEVAEHSSFSKADSNQLKAFLTSSEDTYRPPYGRVVERFPRHTVMVSTSNDESPLKDPTGARRFWPVATPATLKEPIDTDALAEERDQLIAEAMEAYEAGEPYYLPKDLDLEREAEAISRFTAGDPREVVLTSWLLSYNESRFTMADALKALGVHKDRWSYEQTRVGMMLKRIGCTKLGRITHKNMRAVWWATPES